jgi:class 3 adenylate cyclase/ligand-binding sensor domain-containing protein/predicted metal-dependent HD superfamily phosphohydrolase
MMMYFGNARGIMQFDNSEWKIIKTNGIPMLDINSKNEIYFGSYNQLGKLVYKNGLPEIETFEYLEDFKPGAIKKVVAFDERVFFITEHQLLLYENGIVEIELSNAPNLNIFKINENLLVYIPERGLYYWNKNKLEIYNEFKKFETIRIEDILQLNEHDILIKPIGEKGFYKTKNNKLLRFYTEADNFIEDNIYSCAAVLDSSRIIIGTKQGGIVCIDNNGNYLYSINRDNGLRDNQITSAYVDNSNHLWLSTFNGISLIETWSNISFFDASYGLNGLVLSIIRHNNNLYVGTSNGLFKITNSTIYNQEQKSFDLKSRFKRIEDINAMCWQLYVIQNELYAITNQGLFKINKDHAVLILEGDYKSILQLRFHPDKYLLGSQNGLLVTAISPDKVDTLGYLNGIKHNLRTLTQDLDNNIWMGTNQDGLYKTKFKNEVSVNAEVTHYTEKNGFPKDYNWIDVFYSYQGILFSTSKGVYRYSYMHDDFYIDTLLNIQFDHPEKYIYPIVEDHNKNLWYSCIYNDRYERETGVLLYKKENQKYIPYFHPYSQLSEYSIETIYPEKNNVVWFGSSDALIKAMVNPEEKSSKKFPCMIRKVIIGKDSVINIGQDIPEKISVKYFDKTIRFDFTAISYSTIGNIEYQFMLENFNKDWSEWTNQSFKEYTSLYEGTYKFKVKAKDIFGNLSDETEIIIHVTPPFYRSIFAYILYLIIFISIIYLAVQYNSMRHVRERYKLEKLVESRTNELIQQKERVELLVKKLLPQNTANEIQETGNAKSENYEMVTVLFADIEKFTEIAERSNPEELINHLNVIFMVFDKIISRYNIQKIKTIGDAYMCAGGMPTKDNTNPVEVILAGLDMQKALKGLNDKNTLKLEMRVGIHTGPVVAGVVGESKIEYDIWGDTVNIASRMETHGSTGKVNISSATHHFAKDFFEFQYRGKIDVKYKGEMKMYFVDKIKPDLSDDGITPNKTFNIKLQDIRYKMIENEILQQLQNNLPANLYYHNVKHTTDVIYITEDLGRKEKLNDEEMLLLKCAALFHDTGFMVTYDNNEEVAAKLAEQTLKKYKFSNDQIETVKRLILATKMPPNPKDLLEKIICDADLDYLGRPDFIPVSQNLFRELFERGKIDTITQWNKMQYKFVRDHNYFTETARKYRGPGKQNVLKELEEII